MRIRVAVLAGNNAIGIRHVKVMMNGILRCNF